MPRGLQSNTRGEVQRPSDFQFMPTPGLTSTAEFVNYDPPPLNEQAHLQM